MRMIWKKKQLNILLFSILLAANMTADIEVVIKDTDLGLVTLDTVVYKAKTACSLNNLFQY